MDLAETEVIICDDSCEMCNGGWPQNAYEFNMEHGGLLQENSWSYDGDFLYQMTLAKEGASDTYDASYLESYTASMCPSGSGDKSNNNAQRYAKVKGYGYATDRCICYTDGTGCDCDEQDERTALRNVATYGPAAVCLEASTWQDYAGGILTSEVGCSAKFLDMNHCVQAVGYAYVDTDEGGDGDENNSGSGSHSGSGSRDDGSREGYWIIRNQWSTSWGMNGYIYVAMGENTCGVLNDMTVVYL
jgi:cathepsin F